MLPFKINIYIFYLKGGVIKQYTNKIRYRLIVNRVFDM